MSVSTSSLPDDDYRLWQQFREGDTVALGLLAKKYYQTLFNFATKFTKDSALIEDSIQDIFLKRWEHRNQLNDTLFVKFYLLKTLRHHLIKLHHKHEPISETLQGWLDVMLLFAEASNEQNGPTQDALTRLNGDGSGYNSAGSGNAGC